jgi:hypothetical protein
VCSCACATGSHRSKAEELLGSIILFASTMQQNQRNSQIDSQA